MFRAVLIVMCSLSIVSDPALLCATVLTFRDTETDTTRDDSDPGSGEISPGWDIPQSYGDFVSVTTQTGVSDGGSVWKFTYGAAGGITPNVSTTYDTTAHYWEHDYGDLTGVAWSDSDIEISFVAEPGFLVVLEGFDLAGYLLDREQTIIRVQDVVAGGEIYLYDTEQTVAYSDGIDPTHTAFGISQSSPFHFFPLISEYLRIIVSGVAADGGGVGIDNIQFGQVAASAPVLPEPSVLALHVVGGILYLLRRIRRPVRVE